jgi:NADPH:quinone reductase-like Zn-dependent oxidoreductase
MPLPDSMQALCLRHDGYSGTATGPGIDRLDDWVEWRRIAVPQPGPGQVLVRVGLSPVNPSDLHFVKGEYGQPRRQGAPAGFEGMGTVAACGAGAGALAGRRVAFAATASGAWADYALTDAAVCIPLRDDVADADGAALVVNPLTALAMIGLVADARSPAVVLTAAGSELGRLMIALARDRGIAAIAAIRSPTAAAELAAAGAAEVLVTSDPDHARRLPAVMRALKPRVMLDAVGDGAAAALFFAMPAGARWISYGKLSAEPPVLTQMGQLIFMGKSIAGFWLSRWLAEAAPAARAAAVDEAQARFADGRWHTRLAATLSLAEAPAGLAAALAAGGGKVMLRP